MRERGSALIVAALFLLVFLGMSLALVTLGVGTERDVRSTVFTDHAFYLAEAGINASLHEMTLKTDPAKDGLGNVSKGTAGGTYQAVITPIANGEYNVVSTGTYGGFTSRVAVTLAPAFNAISPMGAIGISQIVPDAIDLKDKLNNNNLRVDGGTVPAITIQDPATYNEVLTELAAAIDQKKLNPTVFTGNPLVPVQTASGTLQMPFQLTPSPTIDVPLLEALRVELFNNVETTLIPAANNVISSNKAFKPTTTLGTASSPQITVITKPVTPAAGTKITGHGTLIITSTLVMNSNVSLNWTGDVYLMPTAQDAYLTVNGGNFNVTGNVMSIESIKGKGIIQLTKLSGSVSTQSTGVVNGTLQILNGTSGGASALQVMQGSKLTVNGLLAMSGEKTQVQSKDAGSQLIVNGTMQIGALSGSGKVPVLKFDVTSTAYFTWNKALVDAALQSLSDLLKGRNLAMGPQLFGYTQKAWRTVP